MSSFDYLVVGAGTAGCVLAARLSEDPNIRVALLEAGPGRGPESMADPAAAFSLWRSAVDWGYSTTPQAGTNGAVHPWPAGRVLGGSSSINAMMHIRGHQHSYDAWDALGARGWNHATMLPFLRRAEHAEGRDDDVRGHDGPMIIERPSAPGALALACFRAAQHVGHVASADGNGHQVEGVSWSERNIVGGRRQSVADAYLTPALDRQNLMVIPDARVTRLLLDGTHCYGAEYVVDGAVQPVCVEREVILSAGTIGSPHILMLSGIGPAEHLRDNGIQVVAGLAGVGSNLHDHVISGVTYDCNKSLQNAGPFDNVPHVLCRSDTDSEPDIQLVLLPQPWPPRWAPVSAEGYCVVFALMSPVSRGSVQLNPADPASMPLIDPAYFADEHDLDRMVKGLRLARALGSASPLSPWRTDELAPGPTAVDNASLRHYLRATASTYFHPVGTCRMGVDDLSVVDPGLRVHGISGLRVVDASVMPAIVSANTNATVLAIAERAAVILGDGPDRGLRTETEVAHDHA